MNRWAIMEEDLESYYAAQQYGPRGSVTTSSKTGSPAYSPMLFPTEADAKLFLKRLLEHNPQARKGYKWKVVPFDKEPHDGHPEG